MRLTEQQKVFVVQHLATFHTLSEVRDLLLEVYEVKADLQQIQRYDPSSVAGATLSLELRNEFGRTREAFVKDRSAIPIAQANYRLRELDTLYREAKAKRNFGMAAKLLEQAAMDEGGKFTNRRELTGPGGAPIDHTAVLTHKFEDLRTMSAEDLLRLHKETLGEA